MDPCPVQVTDLGAANEQLQRQLNTAHQQLQAEQATAQRLQQQLQSDRLPSASQSSEAQTSALRGQLKVLSRQNSELSSELAAAQQSLKTEQARVVQQQQQHQQDRDKAERVSWELQHQVDNLTQENQSLLAHHEQLQTRFETLTRQLAKAQHAQHAGALSRSEQAHSLAKASALEEQLTSLMASSAAQVEQRHRLENEVATLQRRLTGAEAALSQQQQRVRGQQEAESATHGKVLMLQQQAESVVEENTALQAQCKQQSAAVKQLQTDVQVRHTPAHTQNSTSLRCCR